MADVTLRPATDADCVALAATMRQVDRDEVEATDGGTPLAALRTSMRHSSHAVTATDGEGRVLCMFGVGAWGFMSNTGVPWLLGSDLLDRYWRLFVRLSPKYLAAILDLYPELENLIDARSTRAIRWLKWLGFTVALPEPIGKNGELMRRFWLRRGLYVGRGSVAEIEDADTFDALLNEYASEVTFPGFPPPAAKLETYRTLEKTGVLHVFVATYDGRLIGFITVLASALPHYDGATVAHTESFFVAKAYRNTLAGLKLLTKAEACAREVGSPGLLVSAPVGGVLAKVLPRSGYVETSRAFFKRVQDV